MFNKLSVVAAVAVLSLASQAKAVVIDFETVPGAVPSEGLAISNQFAATAGVTFSLANGSTPVLAEVGGPRTAFDGVGPDGPAAGENIGQFFLTDDGVTSGVTVSPLIVSYSMATQNVSGEILDIDRGESFVISAFDSLVGGALLDTITINAGDADTGNGVATNWAFTRASADILRIEFAGARSGAGFFGLGFDNFNSGVTVAPAPLSTPATLPLVAAGLCMIGFLARRRKG